jgi:hypothetical protein
MTQMFHLRPTSMGILILGVGAQQTRQNCVPQACVLYRGGCFVARVHKCPEAPNHHQVQTGYSVSTRRRC